jgi:CubicO group peptidase (beta-lactamase class C family)
MHPSRFRGRALTGLALALVAVAWSPAAAQQSFGDYEDVRGLPDTPAGKLAQELLEVVNAGDRARIERFVSAKFAPGFRDAFPMERHLDVLMGLHEQSKEFVPYGVRKYKDERPAGETVVIVCNQLTEAWEAFVLNVDPAAPELIAGLRFAPARPPSDLPPPEPLTEEQLVGELRSYVERLAREDAFSGTVLLAKGGQVLFQGAYGLASKRFNVPNRIDTKFNLGSMNKMFTAVAIAQLVERGQLAFDDPLGKYLDESWLKREILEQVTIHHLLTHTSGLGSYFTEEFQDSSRLRFRIVDDYKPLVRDEELAFEPGTDWRYSNTGMLLAGAVIEQVSGQSYFDYVRANIFEPAGMGNTDSYEMDKPVPNLAIGYSRTADGWENNIFKHVVKGGPAGGGFSTVQDLLRFDQALRAGKLVSRQSAELLWSAKPEANSPDYGYGFTVQGPPENRIVGHGGGFAGINANLDMFLDRGYTAAVMSNYDNGARIVAPQIERLLARARP